MSFNVLPPIPIRSNTQRPYTGSHGEAPPSYRASVQEANSLDITQRLERKIAQYNASQKIWKRWLFEIVSWTTSAACMVSVYPLSLDLNIHATRAQSLRFCYIVEINR